MEPLRIARTIPSSSGRAVRRIGFSIWARTPPKPYLEAYPALAREMEGTELIALVDDILPMLVAGNTTEVQAFLRDAFRRELPAIGFAETHFVSAFLSMEGLWEILRHGQRFNLKEFEKILPKSKKDASHPLSMREILSFLWHLRVMERSVEAFGIDTFIGGMRSEYFYLSVHKALPDVSILLLGV
jgi:hypothetical protein